MNLRNIHKELQNRDREFQKATRKITLKPLNKTSIENIKSITAPPSPPTDVTLEKIYDEGKHLIELLRKNTIDNSELDVLEDLIDEKPPEQKLQRTKSDNIKLIRDLRLETSFSSRKVSISEEVDYVRPIISMKLPENRILEVKMKKKTSRQAVTKMP